MYFRFFEFHHIRIEIGATRNYVDKQGERGGLAKCQRYYISLSSKLVKEGGEGSKILKILPTWFMNAPWFEILIATCEMQTMLLLFLRLNFYRTLSKWKFPSTKLFIFPAFVCSPIFVWIVFTIMDGIFMMGNIN